MLIPAPKRGQGMRAVPLRDTELVQWCADALTQLAGIPIRNMAGGAGKGAGKGSSKGAGKDKGTS